MKKAFLLLLAAIVLLSSVSLAENLSSLSDEELTEYYFRITEEIDGLTEQYDRITEEIENRYRTFWQEYPQGITPAGDIDESALERITLFFRAWFQNSLEDMLNLCTTDWKEETEDPGLVLLSILANRTPVNMEKIAVFGKPDDTERTVAVISIMDIYNGMDCPEYLFRITIKKEADGIWYIDPESLLNYDELWYKP